jgi:hypothetical protein
MLMRRLFFMGVFLLVPIFSAIELARARKVFRLNALLDRNVTTNELTATCHLLICLISFWVMCELCLAFWKSRDSLLVSETSHDLRFSAVLLGGLAFIGHGHSIEPSRVEVSEEAGLPVELTMTPAMAALLIRDILRRRREQIRYGLQPDVLNEKEVEVLSKVHRLATTATPRVVITELDQSLSVVKMMTEAVERIEERNTHHSESPLIVVRLYGYPEVESKQGLRASFRKKRALELLVWLSLNRDRPRRSAARTALWQIDVSDATFSTVVSDMRRGLSEMDCSVDRSEILPATYTDELILSARITTDYELLRESLVVFREDNSQHRALADQLAEIRDVPFSGTSYEWADLDGTTTRLIITAMQASQELAEYAKVRGDVDLMTVAVSAGLRVMPGCEELLHIQEEFLAMKSHARSTD